VTGNYRLIDHTADFGLEIWGRDAAALFEEAAKALFDLLAVPVNIKGDRSHSISVTGDDWPDLMVNWLRELLYMFNGDERILCDVFIRSVEKNRLQATITSETYTPQHHEIKNEIKAVTYHQIAVGPHDKGWRARVIFDV
jgi:SHS2 domain-containing protein